MNKGLIIGIIATILLVGGGVFLFSKNSGNSATNSTKVSDQVLLPSTAEITSGNVNGTYQPAIPNAKVTLVEFGDYQCPACGAYNAEVIDKVLVDFAGKINYAFRDFAFIGVESTRAAQATYCALDQGKYWEFHEYLYSHQNGENKGSFSDDNLKSFAKTMGLDTTTFNKCFDSGKYASQVDGSTNDGKLAGVNSTPSFFINGVKIDNPGSYDDFKTLLNNSLKNAPVPSSSPSASFHIHFDIKAYVNGNPIDFSLAKYQDSKSTPLDENIHFHDGNGSIVHVHKTGIPLSELFKSFRYDFPASTANSFLKVYVNGILNSDGINYVPQDLDQILVTYGPPNDSNISTQIASVTNNACIYSLKCPERGTPPPESCAGGLGTNCTD